MDNLAIDLDEEFEEHTTHSMVSKWVDLDNITRAVGVYRSSQGRFQVHINTYWNGVDSEPVSSRIFFNDILTLQMYMLAMSEFVLNMDRYKIEDKENSGK